MFLVEERSLRTSFLPAASFLMILYLPDLQSETIWKSISPPFVYPLFFSRRWGIFIFSFLLEGANASYPFLFLLVVSKFYFFDPLSSRCRKKTFEGTATVNPIN